MLEPIMHLWMQGKLEYFDGKEIQIKAYEGYQENRDEEAEGEDNNQSEDDTNAVKKFYFSLNIINI